MESAEVVAKTCSKCGENYASNGSPWCRKCRTEHEKTRQATLPERSMAKGWAAGVRAFREELARNLARRPGYTVECGALARYVMDFPAPEFDARKKEPPTEAGG